MAAWLVAADGAASFPAAAVQGGLFILHNQRDHASPTFELCAALTVQRPGPFKALASFPDGDDALDALDQLTMLLADAEVTGVIRWDATLAGWAFQVPPDSDEAIIADGWVDDDDVEPLPLD